MNPAENKVKEYIERADKIVSDPYLKLLEKDENVLVVAQMLQREEHYQGKE